MPEEDGVEVGNEALMYGNMGGAVQWRHTNGSSQWQQWKQQQAHLRIEH